MASFDFVPRSVKRYVRAVIYVFNLHTLLLCCVACTAVYFCMAVDFTYSVDMVIVALGTTFPLTFSIQQAFSRRERALQQIAELKSNVICLYWHHREWNQETTRFPESLGDDHEPWAEEVAALLRDLLHHVKLYLLSSDGFESLAEKRVKARRMSTRKLFLANTILKDERPDITAQLREYHRRDPGNAHMMSCYRCLSKLSVMNEMLTFKAQYARGGEGGMSRTNQYLRLLVSNLEELKVIKEYRTPTMVRYSAGVLIHVFAIILAPYFATFCRPWILEGHAMATCPAGYTVAIVYVLLVTMLFNIQADIEMPFDMRGLDDVFLNLVAEFNEMLGEEVVGEEGYDVDDDEDSGASSSTASYVRTYPPVHVRVIPSGRKSGRNTLEVVRDTGPGKGKEVAGDNWAGPGGAGAGAAGRDLLV